MRSRLKIGTPIFLASLNMRAGLVVISPLIPILKERFDLSTSAISLLAGIPIFCFAATSLIMGQVSRLGSSNRIIKWALTVLVIALTARTFTGLTGLYLFSFIMGISIAVMNYEMPAWVKENAPDSAGFMTGVYTTIMGVTAAVATAVSVPLAELNSLTWQMTMIPWIALAALVALYWWRKADAVSSKELSKPAHFWKSHAFRNPIAWALVLFFGLESMVYYATATWLPTILLTKDFSLRGGAIAVSVSGLVGSIVGLTVPHFVGKFADKRIFLVGASLLTAASFFALALQSGPICLLWLSLSNIGISICFPLSLMLAGTKTTTPEETRNMSTMMQSIGYVLSAMGPGLLGWFYESSSNWSTALFGIVALTMIQLVMGWIVGKPALIKTEKQE